MSARPRVLVVHPGRQHSGQLAVALAERDLLAGYCTGVPCSARALAWTRGWQTYEPLPLPARMVHVFPIASAANSLGRRLMRPRLAGLALHASMALFDRWAARRVSATLDVVVAYEGSALRTFQAARRLGILCVLDAASVHHSLQSTLYQAPQLASHRRRALEDKRAELALADQVITTSSFARRSYIAGGLPEERVSAVPLGCDFARFSSAVARRAPGRPFTFVFAGAVSPLKGALELLNASLQLLAAGHSHRLLFAGAWHLPEPPSRWPHVEWLGQVSHGALVDVFARGDCLVLPSHFDSFGMVVVEGMAAGLPVIVSDHVGAQDLVRLGHSGWVIPRGDHAGLQACMLARLRDPQGTALAGRAANLAAAAYDWSAYRARVAELIRERWLGSRLTLPIGVPPTRESSCKTRF